MFTAQKNIFSIFFFANTRRSQLPYSVLGEENPGLTCLNSPKLSQHKNGTISKELTNI